MAKQANKSGAVKVTLSQAEQVKLAHEAGAAKGIEQTQRDIFNAAAKKLRAAGVKVGDARKCPVAQAFLAGRYGDKAVAVQTKKNTLAAFRAAVNEGKTYDENAKRKAKAAATKANNKAKPEVASDEEAAETEDKPAKGKTHVGTAETATTYSLTIARKGSAAKASQSMRDLMNKMKGSEEYESLAAFVIDALDEFDGEQ